MELRLLGPFEVVDGEGRRVEIRGTKQNALLVLLALRAGEVVPTGQIVEDLWGEQDIRDPGNAVQVLVSKLRRSLQPARAEPEPSLVVTTPAGYALMLDPAAIDAVRFERLAAEGRRLLVEGDAGGAADALRQALGLWRGAALSEFADDQFAQGDRARLEELRASTVELRVEADLALGRHEELTAELEVLIALHPLRERLRAHQMLALYRSNRQADALRAFQATRTLLGEELGLEPGAELRQLELAILAQDPGLHLATFPTDTAQRGNLPAPISTFIGRVDELEEVGALLDEHRLVTLVGPGGAGKTRLALEAAARARPANPDGCWIVELASITDPSLVEAAAASALGLDDAAHLDEFVAGRRALIVIDNCEHLIDAAATLATRLLRSSAGLSVLATSREGLGVTGERRWPVPPLAAGDANALFIDRAEAGGTVAPVGASALVDEICGRLDGLPLAVELAAARTRTLSLDDIAARIEDRFRLLTTGERTAEPRQQTLRGVVDWSYDLLFTDEQRVFRRLSVFAGGFGLRAAELVASGDDVPAADVVDIVGQLVEKSLVSVTTREGAGRYRLLQTLVEYGAAKLLDAGEDLAAKDRHLGWLIGLAAEARPALQSTHQAEWVSILTRERDNLRAGVDWALSTDRSADATSIVADIAYVWLVSGAVNDGRVLLEAVLSASNGGSAESQARAHAWAAYLTQFLAGSTDEVISHAEQAVTIGRASSSEVFGLTAVIAALVLGHRGRTDEALALAEEAAARLELEPDTWSQAWVDWTRSGLALKVGEPAKAEALLRRSVEAFESEGDPTGTAMATLRLGEVAEARGDYDEAFALTAAAHQAAIASGGRRFTTSTTATRLGNIAAVQARYETAAAWHDTALAGALEGPYPGATAQALSGMAQSAQRQGSLGEAEKGHREALALYTAAGSAEGMASALASLGFVAAAIGDHATASDLHLRSLRQASLGQDRRATALALEGLAASTVAVGDGFGAGRLAGAAAAIRTTSGGPILTAQSDDTGHTMEQVGALLGPAGAAAALDEGMASVDEIIATLLARPAQEPG